jgi:RimJ/RimL family protein N-acetyltransferase
MTEKYLFTSERLGFRTWRNSDLKEFAKLNADPQVMAHFPKPLSKTESQDFIDRLKAHQDKHGFCYFATELLETGAFIGFIGLAYQNYKTQFTPAIDIGWRLSPPFWGKGFATEGAKRCLQFAFNDLNLGKIISTCIVQNKNSEKVMQKIGMSKIGLFNHPKLDAYPDMQRCVCYSKVGN